MSDYGQSGKAEVRHRHQDEADQDGALHPQPRIENAADEYANQQRGETDADIVEGDLVIGEAEVLEQQPERQVCQRVADLVNEHEEEDDQRSLALEEISQGAEIGNDRVASASRLRRLPVALRLA